MGKEGGGIGRWFEGGQKRREREKQKEAAQREQLGKIVLQSFFFSMGNGNFQTDILDAVIAMHPEQREVIRKWREDLGFAVPDRSKMKADSRAFYIEQEHSERPRGIMISMLLKKFDSSGIVDTTAPIPPDRLMADPAAALLVRQSVGIIKNAPWHPEVRPRDEKDQLIPNPTPEMVEGYLLASAQKQIAVRLAELFIIESLAVREKGYTRDAIREFTRGYIIWDDNRAQNSLQFGGPAALAEREATSLVCKYALSQQHTAAQSRFPQEIRDLVEAARTEMTEHFDELEPQVQERLRRLVEIWKKTKGEDLTISYPFLKKPETPEGAGE